MEEEAPPAQAPALEDPVGFEALSDDLVIRALVRAPFFCHGSLHAVNHRLKSLLRSDDFRKQRLELGLAEHGVVVAGEREVAVRSPTVRCCGTGGGGRSRR